MWRRTCLGAAEDKQKQKVKDFSKLFQLQFILMFLNFKHMNGRSASKTHLQISWAH